MKKLTGFMFLLLAVYVNAQPRFAHVFSEHMVLQRNAPIPVWGWAKKGEKLTVSLHTQTKQAVADKNGKWHVWFEQLAAGGPYRLSLQSKTAKIEWNDILVGDVWLCSGQSNMEWPLSATENAAKETAAANYPQIRHIRVEHEISVEPLSDIKKTNWQVCSPATAGNFSAVGYYFATNIQKEVNIPVGLLHSSWGGTMVETWISKQGLQTEPAFAGIAGQLPSSQVQFEKEQQQRMEKSLAAFQDKNVQEDKNEWRKTSYDDSKWSRLKAPEVWESQGLPGLDGTIWFRKKFVLTKTQAAKDIILSLGKIDDCDSAWVNETLAGVTCVWDQVRKYKIPAAQLKEGENSIVIRVLDTGGGGGFHGDAADMHIETADGVLSLAGEWKARVDVIASVSSTNPNSMPALLYNAMIHPLLPFAIKGAIWYQGESNAERAAQYARSFPLLIRDWRSRFKQGDFPFYFVQLASFNANNQNGLTGSGWAELRESQLKTLSISNTGMAVTTDIGDAKDIHPRNKAEVGRRLALWALKNEYKKNNVVSGPLYQSMHKENGLIRIQFTHTGSGLMAKGNKYGYLQGFQVAGSDGKFQWAKAWILDNAVFVFNESIKDPVAVRYAWTDDTDEANLYNKEGLPASPFRTDAWKGLTDGINYSINQ